MPIIGQTALNHRHYVDSDRWRDEGWRKRKFIITSNRVHLIEGKKDVSTETPGRRRDRAGLGLQAVRLTRRPQLTRVTLNKDRRDSSFWRPAGNGFIILCNWFVNSYFEDDLYPTARVKDLDFKSVFSSVSVKPRTLMVWWMRGTGGCGGSVCQAPSRHAGRC